MKDAFHRYIIEKDLTSINPKKTGTKACLYYADGKIPPKSSKVLYFRLTPKLDKVPLDGIENIVRQGKKKRMSFMRRFILRMQARKIK